ncbi:MAG: hypothetical protein JW699_03870, partial [Chitinispirillaceae bacterium]|nr:hypothetical protein [Chitinispirillaceae bacterium]
AGYAVDPEAVFGITGEFGRPWRFESKGLESIINGRQLRENRTPSALAALSVTIPPGGEAEFYSVVGNAASAEKLEILSGMLTPAFLEEKREEGRDVIGGIERSMFMVSGRRTFDRYCSQTFLDNVMRGGLPAVFPGNGRDHIFYLYSRKHGDLERDYNYFIVEQTYLSQGNSHFRDVNQNRRSDVWFMPAVGDFNVRLFFNLIQTDGYNPLVVNGITYTLEDERGFLAWLAELGLKETCRLAAFAKKSFTPGAFMMLLDDALPADGRDRDAMTGQLLSFCRQNDPGDLHEGFWIDHWTYNLDLIDSYLMLYPDRRKELFFGRTDYTFYDDPDIVLPRSGKYVLDNGKVRQYRAVVRDREKQKLIASRTEWPLRTRRAYGRGAVCAVNLFVKMLCIIANRAASLDPEGTGVEMEADKPGWNDPMNGLPALLASSLGEALELRRACAMLLDALEQCGIDGDAVFAMYEDLALFIRELGRAIEKRLSSREEEMFFAFWEESHAVKERYREKTKYGVSDIEASLSAGEARVFLAKCIALVDAAFDDHPAEALFHQNGVCYTYFENEAVAYEHIHESADTGKKALSPDGLPLVRPTRFRQRPLALFLEGPVHLIKIKREHALRQYLSVRASAIYDAKLKMFKSSESIAGEPGEVGRVKAYSPGWIENESVYMHMEYKFLLELLRAGLQEEFYEEMKNTMPPFLDPAVYGRSILENSSFIVSSVFPDETLHGRGFQPRLSGASAELVQMWVIMTAGERPFRTDEKGGLAFSLRPVLPSWFFTERAERRLLHGPGRTRQEVCVPENAFAFMLFGRTLCVYRNDKRRDTFGKGGVSVVSYELAYADGRKERVQGGELRGQSARDVRSGAVERMEATLG